MPPQGSAIARRSSCSDASDSSDAERRRLGASRRQSLSLGVTHCPLPQLVEEVEEQEERVEVQVERQENAWDWLVVFASFLCLCVLDGVSYTFGMFLEPLTR